MTYKLSLLFLVTAVSVGANPPIPLDELDLYNATILIPQERVQLCNIEDAAQLFYNEDGFFVDEGDVRRRIQSCDTDPLFEKRTVNDIIKYSMHGKFRVTKVGDGDYRVSSIVGLRGGGAGGATVGFWAGKFIASFVGHGAIHLVAACTGPAYPVTVLALESTVGPMVETASTAVAVGAGILGGVATGPV